MYRNEDEEIVIGKPIRPIKGYENYSTTQAPNEEFKANLFNEYKEFYKLKQNRIKGDDIQIELNITLQEMAQDTHKLKINKKVICAECKGLRVENGNTRELMKCYECQGTGHSSTDKFHTKLNKCPKCKGLCYLHANPCK